tara:strand:+ start:83 stop:406 length:324 start_codon:yes stop_codon:yes gene_type:complete
MKKIRIFLIFNLMFILLASCGTVKEGFSMQKKDNSDEFLVEKKSPLLMPPNFNELPIPKSESILENDKNDEIKKLIKKSDKNSSNSVSSTNNNSTFEELLLDKIKNN